MKAKYKEWIAKNVPERCAGMCREITLLMQTEFPELKRVRGHYYDPIWNEDRAHWWLKDNDEIIDPTASQFPSNGIKEFYTEWDESQEEPTGKCPNCGGYSYNNQTCCSDTCHDEYAKYVMGV